MNPLQQIPSLSDLQQYNVNRPGQIEGIRASLYDFQTYAHAGTTTQYTFFQVPVGQSSKTLADTNMEAAGSLPSPKSFLVESIEVCIFPGLSPLTLGAAQTDDFSNDVYAWTKGGYLNFFIGSKSYLTEAPLGRMPPRNAMHGYGAIADATTAAAALCSKLSYASPAGQPYMLAPPILLVPTQNFNVTLNFPTTLAMPSGQDARVGVILNGILYRNSQ